MNFSEELKAKIRILFENNQDVKEKLLAGNSETIREIGFMSQRRIEPEEVVKAYESGNKNEIEELYRKAKMMIEIQKLYRELCLAYGKELKANTDIDR